MKSIKLVTYNIDGLPQTLDLNNLPWVLRPIAWIYKLIKKTTLISINDNENKEEDIKNISKYFACEQNATIIVVQEDFNYHNELIGFIKGVYNCGKHSGGFDLKHLFSSIEIFSKFPRPRFKADGLNILVDKSRVKIIEEIIVPWEKSYGYVSHANDLLTHKGFRVYKLEIDNHIFIDVYNIHMDADFYDKDKCPDVSGDIEARKSQLIQLSNFIKNRYKTFHRPAIIIGDTNSSPMFTWDINNINNCLIKPINEVTGLHIEEVIPSNGYDVDRIFYINDLFCFYEIKNIECHIDYSANMSDHKPVINNFLIELK